MKAITHLIVTASALAGAAAFGADRPNTSPPVTAVELDRLAAPYVAQARATYPAAKKRFLAGLPQGYKFLTPVFSFGMALTFCGCLLLVNLFPSNHLFLDRSGLRLVAGLGAQQFPDKTAQLSRHCHHRLVALESPRQKTRVATMQPVLSSPTDGPHLLGLTLLAPAQFLAHFGWASVMLGTLHQ